MHPDELRLRPAPRRRSPRRRSSPGTRPGCWSTGARAPRPTHRHVRRPARAARGRRPAGGERHAGAAGPAAPAQGDRRGGRGAAARAGRRAGGGRRWCGPAAGSPPGTRCSTDGDVARRGRRRTWATAAALVRGRHRRPPTRARRGAAAALHPRAAGRPRALPDRLRPAAGVGGGADRRPAPHRRRCSTRCRARGRRASPRSSWSSGSDTFRPDHRRRRVEDHADARRALRGARRRRSPPARPAGAGGRGRHHRRAGARVGRRRRARSRAAPSCSSAAATAFAVVDVLLTNFHLPRIALLVLVDAFVGPRWRDLYDDARSPSGYRFLSLRRRDAARRASAVNAARSTSRRPTAAPGPARSPPPRGTFRTPCFMPVGTRGAVRTCRRPTSRRSASRSCSANTYHLMLRPGADVVAAPRRAARLHGLDGPRAHRLRRLPGVLARRPRSTTTASPSGPPTTAPRTGSRPRARSRPGRSSAPTSRWCSTCARRCRRRPRRSALAVERTAAWAARAPRPPTPARRPGAVRHRAGRHRRRPAGARARGAPSRSASTATASAACRWASREPRCCRRSAATLGELPADRPRYLMGVGDPVGHGRGGRPRRRPVRLRAARPGSAATAPSSPTRGPAQPAQRRSTTDDDGPLDPACACPVCARWSRATCATCCRSASRRRRACSRSTTWPGRCASSAGCGRRSRPGTFAALRAEVAASGA